jgi:tRNA acetyltransferase TAN1
VVPFFFPDQMPKEERKKGGYQKNEVKGGFVLPAGTQGFLITHHRNKDRGALSEIMNLFNNHSETMVEPSEILKPNDVVEEDLEQELKELKSKEKRLFSQIRTGIECTIFIRAHQKIHPVDFAHSLLQEMVKTKQKETRFSSRILPFSSTCFATMRDIKTMAEMIIEKNLNLLEPTTWAIFVKIRNNTKLDRDEVIKQVAEFVDKKHIVNLKEPKQAIVIEVLNHVCGMSILKDYMELKKYNLEQIL